MSDRHIYREIPPAQRRCSYYRCNVPIERNLFKSKDGRLWHYGCWNDARDEHFRCQKCWSSFDATEAGFEEATLSQGDEFKQAWKAKCPHCGAAVKNSSQRSMIEA